MISIAQQPQSSTDVATAEMTPRELQVLRLMCEGATNKGIAIALGISQRTAETHRARLLEKSGCRTSCELGVWAVRRGIVGAQT